MADLVFARAGENERRDQRVPARRSRLRVPVQLARRIEQRDDLINPIEVHRSGLAGLQLASAGVDPDRVAGDQLVLEGNLENLPEAGDRLVHRLGGERFFVDLALAVAVDLGDRDLGQPMTGKDGSR